MSLTYELMDKMKDIYVMECYFQQEKRNKALIQPTIQIHLKNSQRKRSWTQKMTYCMIPFIKKCPEIPNLPKGYY
jgi:hypothetical protein